MPKKKPEHPIEEINPDAPVPQTPDASVPSLTDAPELSPSNRPIISNPSSFSGLVVEKSLNKPKHFRVTNSDVFYKGKSYPEGSIVDFQDDHLNKYLVPIIDEDITSDDTVNDTALTTVSMDTSLTPKYVASRRRGRPRQL
ncbi:MAG: hypothetical protein ACYDA4_09040 [Ignavibacteriaceae bacterium]